MQAPRKSTASGSSARPQSVAVPYLGLDRDLARAATRLGDLDNLDIGRDGAGSAGHGRRILVLLGLVELVLCIRQRHCESEEELAALVDGGGHEAISRDARLPFELAVLAVAPI